MTTVRKACKKFNFPVIKLFSIFKSQYRAQLMVKVNMMSVSSMYSTCVLSLKILGRGEECVSTPMHTHTPDT